jgi:hypothetical protein
LIPTGYHEEKIRKKFGVSHYALKEELGFALDIKKHEEIFFSVKLRHFYLG